MVLKWPGNTRPFLFYGLCEFREFAGHAVIDLLLEGHDEFWRLLQLLPSPAHEFRFVPAAARFGDVDLAVMAGKAQRIPFLRLAAVFPAPGIARNLARDVIGQPFRDFTELLHRADAGLFVKL